MGALEELVVRLEAVNLRLERIENKLQEMNETELMSLNDVANFLGFSHNTIRGMVRNGKLNPVKLGQKFKFKKSDVLKAL